MKFSNYIYERRKASKLTQGMLASHLAARFSDLSDLDANTISRWERSINTPTLQRQRACILFFDDNPNQLLPFNNDQSRNPQALLNTARQQLERQLNIQRFEMLVGGLPRLSTPPRIEHYDPAGDQGAYLEYIAMLDQSILPTEQPIRAEDISQWLSHPGGDLWVCQQHGQTLMHMLLLKLKPAAYKSVLCQDRLESSITQDDLAMPGEPFCLYITSFFSANIDALIEVYIKLYQHLYQQRQQLQRLGTMVANKDGIKLCRQLSMNLRHRSQPDEEGQIYNGGHCYRWATLDAELNQILSHPVARRCIEALTH